MPFEDEIMILEGFEGAVSSVVTIEDIFDALADFSPSFGDNLLTSKIKEEDSLLDGIGDLGRRPRRRPRRPRRRPIRRPMYRGPMYVEPQVIVTEPVDAVSSTTAANRRRLLAMEKKMKALHPDKVKITGSGVEGFGVPVFGDTLTKLGAIRRAAAKPDSTDAKLIVKNLLNKGKNLVNLAARRKQLAANALRGYRGNKKTVEKLERVAKSKADTILKTAVATKGKSTSPALDKKMNNEIKDTRRLRNRAIMAGRKAMQDVKLGSLATILSDNANAQARAAIMTAKAIKAGNMSATRAFSASMVKHSRKAKALKAVRRKQRKLWSGQNAKQKLMRLSARRMRLLKVIAALQQKEKGPGLSVSDKAKIRTAQLALQKVEINMMGIIGGSGISPVLKKKLALSGFEAMTVKDMEPVFSAKMAPLPEEGEWLTDFGQLFVPKFSAKMAPLSEEGKWLTGLDAITVPVVDKKMRAALARKADPSGTFLEEESFVAPSELGPVKFAVPMKPNDPSGAFLTDILGDLSSSLIEDTSFGFLPVKMTVPSWKAIKRMPTSTLKMAEQALPRRSKRVGNALKQRARALWSFSNIGSSIGRAGRSAAIMRKSRRSDRNLVRTSSDFRRRERALKRLKLARYKKTAGSLPGLGDYQKFSIPEAVSVTRSFGDSIPESIFVPKGFGGLEPFSIPEAVWISKGFSDLLML